MSHPQYEPLPQAPPSWPAQSPAPSRGPSRLLPILGVVLGLLGLIAGVAAWFRAAPANDAAKPTYSDQQVADAKKAVCDAYAKAVQSFQVAGNKKANDPADQFLIAVNARVSVIASGNYMRNVVDANPEAPQRLKVLVSKLAQAYQEIGITQLADESQPAVDAFASAADSVVPEINGSCK